MFKIHLVDNCGVLALQINASAIRQSSAWFCELKVTCKSFNCGSFFANKKKPHAATGWSAGCRDRGIAQEF
jgi:hypothetical protein